MRRAVYAGSFDPPTRGHEWMIRRGAELFDLLTVAVGIHPGKRPLLPVEERVDLLRGLTRDLPGVAVDRFEGVTLADYARGEGARFLLRGVRGPADLELELPMRRVNGDLGPELTTVLLLPPAALADVSSTLVKSLIGLRNWMKAVSRYVPVSVLEGLARHVAGT